MARILVVDDEPSIVLVMKSLLTRAGHAVSTADNGDSALILLANESYDLLISDVCLPGLDGLSLIKKAKELHPDIQTTVMTAYSDVDGALEAMKSGASDYLVKPFNFNDIVANINRNLSSTQTLVAATGCKRIFLKHHYGLMVGDSKPMMEVYIAIEKSMTEISPLLIHGASGTGKELCAKAIHSASMTFSGGAFVSVDCATLSPDRAAAELFGSFDKSSSRNGLFMTADGGTLYLKNIEYLTQEIQMKITDFIDTREITPVGADSPIPLNLRLIASTRYEHCEDMIHYMNFDRKFYKKLTAEQPIRMPGLSERGNDFSLLVMKFLDDFEFEQRRHLEISDSAFEMLKVMDWSDGQLDRLHTILKSAFLLCKTDCITDDNIRAAEMRPGTVSPELSSYSVYHKSMQYAQPAFSIESIPEQMSLRDRLKRIEVHYIRKIIADCDGDKERAAERLGISLATLYRKLE